MGRLIGFCVALPYFGVLNSTVGHGQTIGKRIMKIEVVDRSGSHISPGRSFLRYLVLGTPIVLNGAMLTGDVIVSPVGALISFVTAGLGGATGYLYLFNRQTRQSLHDLVAGTLVTRVLPAGPVVAPSIWRPHLVIVGILWVVVVGLSVGIPALIGNSVLAEPLALQKAIQASGKVHAAGVTVGQTVRLGDGDRVQTTYIQTRAVWKDDPGDYASAARQVAAIVFRQYPDITTKDVLAVTITYVYDIGIAPSSRSNAVQHSPQEWQRILAER